jgi:hypothetical protein
MAMNALERLQSVQANLLKRLADVRGSRFFHDRLSVSLVIAALAIDTVAIAQALLHLHITDIGIPVRYSTLRGFYMLGPWYFPLELAAFSLLVTLINTAFAYSSYMRSRLASFFLLSGAVVVAVFGLIVSGAFGAVVPQ